jgi:hypothetical protein
MAGLVQALMNLIFIAGKIATVDLGIIHQKGYAMFAVQELSVQQGPERVHLVLHALRVNFEKIAAQLQLIQYANPVVIVDQTTTDLVDVLVVLTVHVQHVTDVIQDTIVLIVVGHQQETVLIALLITTVQVIYQNPGLNIPVTLGHIFLLLRLP